MIMIFVRNVGGSIIRDVTIKVADEKDLEFMQGLQNLGVNRTVACVITYLKGQNEEIFQGYRDGHGPETARGQHRHANPAGEGLGH